MKKLFTLLTISLFATAAFAQKSSGTDTLVVKTNIHCNHCLHCGSCGPNITNSVMATAGVKDVKINPEENTITIFYKSGKTTPEEIRTAINNAGFDADDQKAPEKAFKKLDACCKPQ